MIASDGRGRLTVRTPHRPPRFPSHLMIGGGGADGIEWFSQRVMRQFLRQPAPVARGQGKGGEWPNGQRWG